MSLAWTIDTENHLMIAVADGEVTRVDVENYLDAIIANQALTYRKVFDASKGATAMTADDLLPLGVRLRSMHEAGQMGPLAVVVAPGKGKRLARTFGMLAVADRPMQVFDRVTQAYRWIEKQAELTKAPRKRSRLGRPPTKK
jgi:hypothetical protein